MNIPTNVDLNGWQPLLDRHQLTAEQINHDDGDPTTPAAIARREITRAENDIPFIYRRAVPEQPDIHTWIDQLAATAREDQNERNAPVATIGHNRSLLLLGPTGVGKTHQAYGALRDLAVTGINLRWTAESAADLYANLRPRHGVDSEAEFRRYTNAALLLVDDLGAGRAPTEFTEEVNFRLVNHRYENQLPTIFTTNVLPKELSARLGDRVASRLVEMCDRVVITGQDRRRQVAA